ncbi:MAG: ABC transporter ATP-binding protein [Halobacterium sp.]
MADSTGVGAGADAGSGGDAPLGDADVVVRATDLSKSFGDVDVLERVSFEVPVAATTAVVGPNGSGKTTLAELITGIEGPTGGSVEVVPGGERPVGYLPQAPAFQPTASVRETLEFYARLLSEPTDVDAALDRVGLGAAADRRVTALSGGMRRLLGVAVSLLGTPPLLVLDEPTSGLDPQMSRHVFDVVTRLAADGQSVLLTTHDLSRAAAADHILVLSGGDVVLSGSPDAVVAETGADSLAGAFDDAVGGLDVARGGEDA